MNIKIHKKITDSYENKNTFHERKIWFIKIGENVGFEQNGKGNEIFKTCCCVLRNFPNKTV